MHFNRGSQVVPQRVAADIVSWNPAQTFGTSFVITTPSEHLKAFQQCFKSAWRMALSSASGALQLVCQDTLSTLSLCWRSILLVDSKHLTAKRSLSAKMAQMLWTQMDVPLRCFGQTNVVLVSVNRVFWQWQMLLARTLPLQCVLLQWHLITVVKQDRPPGSPHSEVLIVYECCLYSMSPLTLAVSLLEMEMSSVNAGTFLSNYIHLRSTIGT